MNAVQLALRVLRVDRRTRTSAILTAIGVAVATGLVLLLVSLPFATQARSDRAAWQLAGAGGKAPVPTLSFASSTDYTGGDEIVRIDVAALTDPATVTLPPGIPALPGPGEMTVSPELGKRLHALPAAQLGDRFGARATGALGEDALEYPEQLVALVGHDPASMPEGAMPMNGFHTQGLGPDPLLQLLSGVGVVVLLVPSLVLVASSARLTAARRERRLAALRLAGATPGQVTGMVAAETALSAVGGALLGLAVTPVLNSLASLVPWDGGTWQVSDFALPFGVTALIVLAVPALVLLAAMAGLRRVVSTPLVAAGSHTRKPLRWWRLLALPATGLVFLAGISSARDEGETGILLAGLFLTILSAALVGPWVTSAIGGTFVRGWRKPAGLLAGRRLRDDPKGAYRASAGVVLAVFVGSMALTLLPSFEAMGGGGRSFQDSVLYVETDAEAAPKLTERVDTELARYGRSERGVQVGKVTVDTGGSVRSALVLDCAQAAELTRFDLSGACGKAPGVYGGGDVNLAGLAVLKPTAQAFKDQERVPFAPGTPMRTVPAQDADVARSMVVDPAALPKGVPVEQVTVAVRATPEDRETVRTALVRAAGGTQVASRELHLGEERTLLSDLRRVTVIGVVVAGLLAGCSAAIATAGSVMDRRRTFGALIAAGTPVRVLARSLRAEAALPAMVATIGAGVVGVLVGMGLLNAIHVQQLVLSPWILAPVVLGALVAVLAASVCTPALNRVRSEPLAQE
jgi:hypothetical protein